MENNPDTPPNSLDSIPHNQDTVTTTQTRAAEMEICSSGHHTAIFHHNNAL
jgi:hypothetical protein